MPPAEWVVGLGNAAAVCGECGAGAAAWRLVTDLVYHDSFGLMKWSPGSLQVRVVGGRAAVVTGGMCSPN